MDAGITHSVPSVIKNNGSRRTRVTALTEIRACERSLEIRSAVLCEKVNGETGMAKIICAFFQLPLRRSREETSGLCM